MLRYPLQEGAAAPDRPPAGANLLIGVLAGGPRCLTRWQTVWLTLGSTDQEAPMMTTTPIHVARAQWLRLMIPSLQAAGFTDLAARDGVELARLEARYPECRPDPAEIECADCQGRGWLLTPAGGDRQCEYCDGAGWVEVVL